MDSRGTVPRRPSASSSWVLLVAVVLGLLGLVPRTALASENPRVHPALLSEAKAKPNQQFRVIVQGYDKVEAEKKVKNKGYGKLKNVASNGFVVVVKGKHIEEFGNEDSIRYISPDVPMVNMVTPEPVSAANLANLYAQSVNASGLWASSITGANVGVAVIDSGMKTGLVDFQSNGVSRVVVSKEWVPGTDRTNDPYGHGTHVAGIIAGNSWWRTDLSVKGKYIGVAPQANLINVRVADDAGMSYVSDVVNAIDWVVANRATYNIRVMNLSLIQSIAESYTTSILDAAVERAWFNGIFVVVSAGNGGPNVMSFPPANDPFVVTVGAVDQMGTPVAADDTLAPWSSYGMTQNGVSKPEVVAPGRYITSTSASMSSTLALTFPTRLVGSNYIWLSGTSMAAPVVSGVAALAFQAHPEWTNDQLKWLLMKTSTRLGGATPLAGQGAGEVNALAAVQYSGVPSWANQGIAISQQLVGPNGATTYDTSSWSSSSWSSSSWSSSSWSSSSWSSSSWSSASWSSNSWQSCGYE